jgi:branched-chain amino acid transport system substrate-binding protein
VNARGGLLGRKVAFVLYDDQSTPATGVRLYEKLITEDKVDAVMGPYSSPITEAVANVSEKYQKVLVSPLAATTSIFKKGRKYIFMVISPAEVYLEGLIDMAAKRGLKTVAVLNEDTLFTKASATGVVELAKKRGMQVVFQEAYPKGNTDFSAMLTKVKAANPDVIAASTYFDDAVAITRQMKELNVSAKMYGVTVGGDLPKFYDLLKQNAEYVYGATQWEGTLPYPGQKEFVEAYQKKFNREPVYHSAAGYAGCAIYAEGVRRAGTLDSDKVREQLLKLETKTFFGDYKVDQDGFQTAHKMVMFQWQDGKKVTVWPDDLAGGKARFPTPPWSQR